MTNQLFDALSEPNATVVEPFFLLTTHVLGRLGSSLDVFAYIETEYFGGSGAQRAGDDGCVGVTLHDQMTMLAEPV